MSSPEDISPNNKPFSTRMRDFLELPGSGPHPEVAHTVYDYIDIAKRMLLELRVRDFSASDVVALAAIMEARDRAIRTTARTSDNV